MPIYWMMYNSIAVQGFRRLSCFVFRAMFFPFFFHLPVSPCVQEELAQTEGAISLQTGGEGDKMAKLRLMQMELEGEVKDLEAQLEAKKGALREVISPHCCRLLHFFFLRSELTIRSRGKEEVKTFKVVF